MAIALLLLLLLLAIAIAAVVTKKLGRERRRQVALRSAVDPLYPDPFQVLARLAIDRPYCAVGAGPHCREPGLQEERVEVRSVKKEGQRAVTPTVEPAALMLAQGEPQHGKVVQAIVAEADECPGPQSPVKVGQGRALPQRGHGREHEDQ